MEMRSEPLIGSSMDFQYIGSYAGNKRLKSLLGFSPER
jgi:hypothetical protein